MRSCVLSFLCLAAAAGLLACSSSESADLSPARLASPRTAVVDAALCAPGAPAPSGTGPVYETIDAQCVRTQALLGLRDQATARKLAAQAATTLPVPAPGDFLDWAQRAYPTLFPGSPANQLADSYLYRYYPATQMALGVSGDSVYAMGPLTTGVLVRLGGLIDYACAVTPSNCDSPVTPTQPDATAFQDNGYTAETSFGNSYCSDNVYPSQWEWNPAAMQPQPAGATSGTPLVKHIRNGIVIATYTKLGGSRSSPNNQDGKDNSVGPFRRQVFTQWRAGDVFEIYPAVYEGEDQQIYVGPNTQNDATYTAKQFEVPRNITIRGVTVNGVRPVIKLPSTGASNNTLGQSIVYFDQSENITMENLDIVSGDYSVVVGKAAIYINGARNLTLKNIRVSGFHRQSANGIFGTNNNSGVLSLQNVELADNGGGGGPEHNMYINASRTDPKFTVKMTGSWSHNSYYGHLFKSRAQVNILEGNYFQGSRSTQGEMRESWLVDIPDGGELVARNNVFVKNYSGDFTNGAALTFAVEQGVGTFDVTRPWGVTVEHNTFVTFSRYYDSQKHEIYPFFINTKAPVLPENVRIRNNLFVGYCQTPSTVLGNAAYFGSNYSIVNFNGIDQAFRPRVPALVEGSTIVGTPAYFHKQFVAARRTTAAGARD